MPGPCHSRSLSFLATHEIPFFPHFQLQLPRTQGKTQCYIFYSFSFSQAFNEALERRMEERDKRTNGTSPIFIRGNLTNNMQCWAVCLVISNLDLPIHPSPYLPHHCPRKMTPADNILYYLGSFVLCLQLGHRSRKDKKKEARVFILSVFYLLCAAIWHWLHPSRAITHRDPTSKAQFL